MSDNQGDAKKILILYDHHETHVKTTADYLQSFQRFSRHHVSYASSYAKCHFDLSYFDAVVIHYCVRVCQPGHLSASFAQALKKYKGLKVLFIQDEYENTNAAKQAILDLGIGLVFTCIPVKALAAVFPPAQISGVKFVNVLTGYVPIELSQLTGVAPIRQRAILLGYRGRNIGYWYGDRGQEKRQIGMRFKEICDRRGLTTDIAWEEKDRIYDGWFDFLGRCKATLGTESGANIFDWDGTLKAAVLAELDRNPNSTYEEIRNKYLAGREGEIVMNQVSPKVFEAIACRTALVLFEGRYSDVLEPGKHYLPLKKDFSNVDEVLARLDDDASLEAMAERAYADVIGSGRYSYQTFVGRVDEVLEQSWQPRPRPQAAWLPLPPCDALATFRTGYRKNFEPSAFQRAWWWCMPKSIRAVINRERIKRLWTTVPGPVRTLCRPILQRLRSVFKPAH